jgi:4-hydroxybenzoate polyprenyltransferase
MSKYLFFALRPKHWIKNGFVFLPLVFGHKLFDVRALWEVSAMFVLFCLASSSVYLINDLEDKEKDKAHPSKRLRPIASGKIKPAQALQTAVLLAVISLFPAFFLNAPAALMLAIYLVFNILYSKWLKDFVIIDVFCLGFFFILRILAGTYAADVAVSHWIILMAGLLALFLGFNKRRQELKMLGRTSSSHRLVLTKYNLYFIDQVVGVLTASTVVAYTFYTIDERTVGQVGSNHMMLTIPFVYYGIFRYLYLLHRRHWDGDPTRLLLSDLPMQVNLGCWLATAIGVVYFGI